MARLPLESVVYVLQLNISVNASPAVNPLFAEVKVNDPIPDAPLLLKTDTT